MVVYTDSALEAAVMLPILYDKTTTVADFEKNGLGFIKNCTKCIVTEERNGKYELAATVLNSDRLANVISPLMFIKCKPSTNGNPQIFEIYQVDRDRKNTIIKAQHIRYRLSANVLTEGYVPATPLTPLAVWQDIVGGTNSLLAYPNEFMFESDIDTTYIPTAARETPIRLGDFLLGKRGSMLDTWGGEFEFDNFTVKFNSRRGVDTGICWRAGAGVNNFSYTVNSDQMFTDISAYARFPYVTTSNELVGDIYLSLPSPVSTGNTILSTPRALSYDFTETVHASYPKFVVKTATGHAPIESYSNEALAKLRTLVNNYIRVNAQSLRYPAINMQGDVLESAEDLKNVNLCDTIKIYYEPLNVDLTAKVVKLNYDVLREKNIGIELGTLLSGMSRYFSNTNFGGL